MLDKKELINNFNAYDENTSNCFFPPLTHPYFIFFNIRNMNKALSNSNMFSYKNSRIYRI
jgi:hypothetical protein